MFWTIVSFIAGLIGAHRVKQWAQSEAGDSGAHIVAPTPTVKPGYTPSPTPYVDKQGLMHDVYIQQPTNHHVVMWILLVLLMLIGIRAVFGPDWWTVLPFAPRLLARANGVRDPERGIGRPLGTGEKPVTHEQLFQAVSEAVGPAVDIAIRRELRYAEGSPR